jgi:hypothetical protein
VQKRLGVEDDGMAGKDGSDVATEQRVEIQNG